MKFLVNKNESVDVFFLVLNDYVKWPLKFIQVSVFLFNVFIFDRSKTRKKKTIENPVISLRIEHITEKL